MKSGDVRYPFVPGVRAEDRGQCVEPVPRQDRGAVRSQLLDAADRTHLAAHHHAVARGHPAHQAL